LVLIIDDMPDTCRVLQKLLERGGYPSQCVSSAAEAMSVLRAVTPNVIVLDDMMPIRTGVELLAELKDDARLSSIPVVMYSAGQDEERVQQALRMGAAAWLSKGRTSWTELLGSVARLYDPAGA
jgi:CheY-like chemotaxis protein